VKSEEMITERFIQNASKNPALMTFMTLIKFVGPKPSGEVIRRTEHMNVDNQDNYQMDFS